MHYGKMSDNVAAIEGRLADGTPFALREADNAGPQAEGPQAAALAAWAEHIARAEATEIERRFPKVQRRVGGYNLDALLPEPANYPRLLVGSEGTLAVSTAIELKLAPLPTYRVMGVCHFPSFRAAMETTRHLVALGPVAVELVDNHVLVLGAALPDVARTLGRITRGTPDCLLLVEFAGEELAPLEERLRVLDDCMADHGFPQAVVPVVEPAAQAEVWSVREACLNIMMSMKGDGKPISFIEDCAVPLEMKTADGVRAMRAIAEEAFELVRRFEGSHSGEHGDGISRSEFHAAMFGPRLVRAFEAVKDAFDPEGRLNPGKSCGRSPWTTAA
jgi:FAD/FMN-containing dehydrogenase